VQTLPTPQSALVEQATGAPASSAGGVHWSLLQTVPWGQSALVLHVGAQPFVVQVVPAAQSALLEQDVCGGGLTVEHPRPSQL
jgi:hypothetical protein